VPVDPHMLRHAAGYALDNKGHYVRSSAGSGCS
jgi:hypothetical protein